MIDKIIKNKKYWILGFILILGIFLRTYRFHDWLEIKSDQIRDALLVHEVVTGITAWPLLGPWVGGTGLGTSEINSFRLGPIYYYFQIISVKIFGDYLDKLAYPDLFFSILSIPLFYLLFKKYFRENLSLSLTGLYAVSFFAVHYSRFAWNPNSIPFFTLLLLLALYEFVTNKEKTSWFWAVILGTAVGIGIQLHIITFVLFPAAAFLIFALTMKNNWRIWKKWAVVLLIFVILNMSQLISEVKTNFANSKILLNDFSKSRAENGQNSGFLFNLEKNIDCHIEANTYILSSLGQDTCSFNFIKLMSGEKSKGFLKSFYNPFFDLALFGGFIFSFVGYWLLARYCKKEKEKNKKYFLRLITMYLGFIFLIMLYAIKDNLNFRYFDCAFFAPFLFLGFLLDYFYKKFNRFNLAIAFILCFLVLAPNVASIGAAAKELSQKGETGYHSDFLVQIEPIAKYLIDNSEGKKDITLAGDFSIMHIYNPLEYLLKRQNINLVRRFKGDAISPVGMPLFYISNKPPSNTSYEKIWQNYIFKIKN